MSRAGVYIEELPQAPQADIDLDMRTLDVALAQDDDGDPVMVLRDGGSAVVLEFGLGGGWESAIVAAEKLGAAAARYANLLREVRATRRAAMDQPVSPAGEER